MTSVQDRLADRPPRDADSTWLFGLFGLLFALSLILHQLWWDGFEVSSPHFLVILAALWTALRPTSVVRFLTMIGMEVFAVALDMPDVGSHTLLVLVGGICLLTFAAWTTLREWRLPDAAFLFERMAPFFAVQLLLVYAVAAVAKMNTGFFNPDISCARPMLSKLAWSHLSFLDATGSVTASIWGTVLIEVALPVLLAVRRSRMLGLILGGAFHAVLALAGNVPFSALALALYVALLPADTPTRLRSLVAARPDLGRWASRTLLVGRSRAAFPVAVGCWLAGAAVFTNGPAPRPVLISIGTRLLLVIAFAAAILLTLGLAREGSPGRGPRPLRLRHPVFSAGILLLVLNSLTPYVGLKTESSFTMFSNLRTEGGQWNHLFIPKAVRVFPPQDDLVRITASNDQALQASTANGLLLVRFELERYLRSHPGTTATYVTTDARGETTRTAGPATARTALSGTLMLDKIIKFQAVPSPEPGRC